ncbi:hypothetical protein MGG_00439 [Pyricularia oryzae 70-15]|uniref:Uncharacterized protein n=2 Tax=Pyricularia oryzae TaxID=318829 RepID=G4NC42_PYRO7|nr:uncharacterized protein MGG_00439 [Pyricularia oryzae 70-15]EHA49045.1 hypothetical protein MGG_00439 [Pyricularia oryzae 70-15]ELQ42591.1 hypothetical protein OOU_Y34scaffold00203g80 [Pyricularia oryzae Y34]KAI7926592.1 hypothetical protein M0657_003680 [Pyricularia oryzae]KAI7929441.1 hypothetical protein M9X92_001329 [Pyricularia oryzae]
MLSLLGNLQSSSRPGNANTRQDKNALGSETPSTACPAARKTPSSSGDASASEQPGSSNLYSSPGAGRSIMQDPGPRNPNWRWQTRQAEDEPKPNSSRHSPGEPASRSPRCSRRESTLHSADDGDTIDVYWHNLAADHEDSPGIFIGMRDLYAGSVDDYIRAMSRFLNRTAGVLRLHSVSIFPRSAVVVVDTQLTALYVRAAMRYSGMSPPNLYHIPGFQGAGRT